MDKLKDISKIIEEKELSAKDADLAEECMLELCSLCDTKKSLINLNEIFSNLSDGVIIFDLEHRIINTNRKAKSFLAEHTSFEYDQKEYPLTELPVFDLDAVEKTIKVVSRNTRSERKVFNLSCSLTYSAVSQPIGICMVLNDITEVEKQVRQMEDMMASFTHDLKTPLIALETNVEHILDGEYGELNDNLRTILNLMLKSSSNTLRLVKNLLTVFKYDTKSYKLLPKNVKIREVINNAIKTVEPLLSSKKIRVTTDLESDYSFFCDSFEIERVLMNLLSNSIKFSPNESQINIHVSREGDFYIVSVNDFGQGIAKEQLSSLFNRFWQAKVYDSSTNGTGLGLYLSRQIVEAHGGVIWAEEKKEKGTKICFKLPANSAVIMEQNLEIKA